MCAISLLFDFMNFPVFNFADSCITVGAVLLIVSVLFTKSGRAYFAALDEKSRSPKKRTAKKPRIARRATAEKRVPNPT